MVILKVNFNLNSPYIGTIYNSNLKGLIISFNFNQCFNFIDSKKVKSVNNFNGKIICCDYDKNDEVHYYNNCSLSRVYGPAKKTINNNFKYNHYYLNGKFMFESHLKGHFKIYLKSLKRESFR